MSFASTVKQEIAAQWLVKLLRENTLVNKNSYICSQHFEDNCFIKPMGGQRICLKPDSIPTKFIFTVEKPKRKKPVDFGRVHNFCYHFLTQVQPSLINVDPKASLWCLFTEKPLDSLDGVLNFNKSYCRFVKKKKKTDKEVTGQTWETARWDSTVNLGHVAEPWKSMSH